MSYEVECEGGPLDGQRFSLRTVYDEEGNDTGELRYPKGFLVVNRPEHAVVIYKPRDDRDKLVAGEELVEDKDLRMIAAFGEDYDVVAYDPERMGPWQPTSQ